MARQDETIALTSFLYGGNAAYIEDLYARYEADPASVDAQWQAFFSSLGDDRKDVVKNAEGPPGRSRTGRSPPMASSSPPWTATGRRSRRSSATS